MSSALRRAPGGVTCRKAGSGRPGAGRGCRSAGARSGRGTLPFLGMGRFSAAAAGAGLISTTVDVVLLVRGEPYVTGTALGLLEPAALLALTVPAMRRARTGAAVAAAALAAVAVPLWLLRFGPPTWSAATAGGFGAWATAAALAVAAGLYLRGLDRARARAAEEARRAQRLELADDLHDFVVHDINEMLLQAQAGQIAAGEAVDALRRIERTALRALATVDRTVHLLSAGPEGDGAPRSPKPAVADMPELVDRFAATGAVSAGLDLDPALRTAGALPVDVGTTVYRVVVEALTNVRRHARGARHVSVVVARTPQDGVRVEVTDDGRPGGRGASGSGRGQGLAGLGARVEALGGTLSAGPAAPAGWRVAAELPASVRAARAVTP